MSGLRSNGKPFSFYSSSVQEPNIQDLLTLLFQPGHADDFKEVLSQYPHLLNRKEPDFGNVAVHIASSRGDIGMVNYLISRGADLTVQDIFGNSALHYAVDKGKHLVVEILLQARVNVNQVDFRGNSPIHSACVNNDVESVKLLIKYNADPELADHKDVKPRDKTKSPLIRSLIDRRIHMLHTGEQEEAKSSMQWMSFGVGLGVGLGVALAKYQQAMIEHQVALRTAENKAHKRRGNFSSLGAGGGPPTGGAGAGGSVGNEMVLFNNSQTSHPSTANHGFSPPHTAHTTPHTPQTPGGGGVNRASSVLSTASGTSERRFF